MSRKLMGVFRPPKIDYSAAKRSFHRSQEQERHGVGAKLLKPRLAPEPNVLGSSPALLAGSHRPELPKRTTAERKSFARKKVRTQPAPSTGEHFMGRRRMYVYERAYRDYGTCFKSFYQWILRSARSIWNWFWIGAGSKAIEVLLRIGVVASGIGLGFLYVRYEDSQGRGFSIGMALAFLVIAGYVSLLMYGWKAPVHFTARALSGALGASLAFTAGLAVFIPAMLVFGVYLAGLLLLTALSFLVFLPLRAGQELWLLSRKLGYHCPNDDCNYKGLPIHICECGDKYHDLLPSFHGILHHTCRHEAKYVKLPTLDLLGRSKLTRLCGGCQRPLIHSSIGELEVRPIAVVGGTNAGKTVFLTQAIRQLRERLGSSRGSAVRIDSERQQQFLEQQNALLDNGQVLAKTAGDVMEAIGLAVRAPELHLRCLLHLFDAPGEKFTTMQRLGQMQAMTHLQGIVILVDPFGLPVLADPATMLGQDLNPSGAPVASIVDNIINAVNLLILDNNQDQCSVPVAVVLSKADAFPTDIFPFLADLSAANGDAKVPPANLRCRDALIKLGARWTVEKLEQKFTNVRYFACSALGRMPDPHDTRAFQPAGVGEPFLWLLERE